MNFDTWEAGILPDEDALMHWGIPGMKHGRNRYQNPDGTWTEEGLARRRQREGFGEGQKERRLAKKVERAEKREARKAAKAERREARHIAKAVKDSNRRKNNLSDLTDEELKRKLERAKMEQEYKEITRSPLIKSGEHLVNMILDYKDKKEQRVIELNKQRLEWERLKVNKTQAIEASKKAKEDRRAAEYEMKKKKYDVKGGLKEERKKDLLNAKTNYRSNTIWGSIGKRANNKAKYVQENRMNDIEAKKAARTRALQELQLKKQQAITRAEYWKAEQEKHKAKGRKP